MPPSSQTWRRRPGTCRLRDHLRRPARHCCSKMERLRGHRKKGSHPALSCRSPELRSGGGGRAPRTCPEPPWCSRALGTVCPHRGQCTAWFCCRRCSWCSPALRSAAHHRGPRTSWWSLAPTCCSSLRRSGARLGDIGREMRVRLENAGQRSACARAKKTNRRHKFQNNQSGKGCTLLGNGAIRDPNSALHSPPWTMHWPEDPRALVKQPGTSQRLPPPWPLHLPDAPTAFFSQPSTSQRFPPPCATQRPVLPTALFGQLSSSQRRPPPCAMHLPVGPTAAFRQFYQKQKAHIYREIISKGMNAGEKRIHGPEKESKKQYGPLVQARQQGHHKNSSAVQKPE